MLLITTAAAAAVYVGAVRLAAAGTVNVYDGPVAQGNCVANNNGPSTAYPECLGMNEYEPINMAHVFRPDATSTNDYERCPCTWEGFYDNTGAGGLAAQFPVNSSYPYQWILYNESTIDNNFTNCPQVFCFLRVALETLPKRSADGTGTSRASFIFTGGDYSSLPKR